MRSLDRGHDTATDRPARSPHATADNTTGDTASPDAGAWFDRRRAMLPVVLVAMFMAQFDL